MKGISKKSVKKKLADKSKIVGGRKSLTELLEADLNRQRREKEKRYKAFRDDARR